MRTQRPMLDVRNPGVAALLGDPGVQGFGGGQKHRPLVTGADDYRAAAAFPVPVDGVGCERRLDEAGDRSNSACESLESMSSLEMSTFSGESRSEERFPVLMRSPGAFHKTSTAPLSADARSSLLPLRNLGSTMSRSLLGDRPRCGFVAGAFEGEDLERGRRVHLDGGALAPRPAERVVRVLYSDPSPGPPAAPRGTVRRRTSCGSRNRPVETSLERMRSIRRVPRSFGTESGASMPRITPRRPSA